MTSILCTCGAEIPPERLKVLPDTKVCVTCSDVVKYKGFTTGNNDRQGDLQILDGDSEGAKYMDKYNKRAD